MFADALPDQVPTNIVALLGLIILTLLGCLTWAYKEATAQNKELRASYERLVERTLTALEARPTKGKP